MTAVYNFIWTGCASIVTHLCYFFLYKFLILIVHSNLFLVWRIFYFTFSHTQNFQHLYEINVDFGFCKVCGLAAKFFVITTGYRLMIFFFLKEVYNINVCTVPWLFFLVFVLVFDVPSIDNQLRQLPDFKTVHVLKWKVHCILQGVIGFVLNL